MKAFAACLVFLGAPVLALAVPDPRDSIILESKTIAPSNGPVATTMRVWITNKDTLASFVLVLEEQSSAEGTYLVLAYPRTYAGMVTPLTTTLQSFTIVNPNFYHGDSPDSFLVAGFYDPLNIPNTAELPNAVRKPFYEIRYDTVRTLGLGTVEFDSGRIFSNRCHFVDQRGLAIDVNFVKSVITVAPKGDLNVDGFLTPVDAVVLMNCVFREMTPPAGPGACDLNCDNQGSAADVVILLNAAFMDEPFPC